MCPICARTENPFLLSTILRTPAPPTDSVNRGRPHLRRPPPARAPARTGAPSHGHGPPHELLLALLQPVDQAVLVVVRGLLLGRVRAVEVAPVNVL